jgi:hypothetical protein
MKKLLNYFGAIVNKFNVVVTALVIIVPFIALVLCEAKDVPTAILNGSKGGFIAIAAALVIAAAAYVVLLVKNLKDQKVTVLDLVLLALAALAVFLLVLFCFNPGNGSVISVLKWVVAAVLLVASAAAAYFRAQSVK